jgi:MFS family permease
LAQTLGDITVLRNGRGSVDKLTPLRRNRDFNLLWSGDAVSSMGTQVSTIAYPLLILATTGSAAKAGLVSGALMLGNVLALPPAGVVADRYPRKKIMVISSLAQTVVVATVVVAVLTHHVLIPHLMAVGLIQGVAQAFYYGANRASVRRLVPIAQLPQAQSAIQAREQGASLLGPPAGGALFSLARFLPFGFDSLSFAAIAIAAAAVRTPLDPAPSGEQAREPLRTSITRGVRFVLGLPFMRAVTAWGTVINFIATGMLLMVIVLARSRGATPLEIGALLAINATCGLLGALGAPRMLRSIGGRRLALITSWMLPCGAVAIAYAPSIWLIGVIGAVSTFTVTPVSIALQSRATQITPDHLQAQASNTIRLFAYGLAWVAPPVFGALADGIGIRPAILIAGGGYALAAAWLQSNRSLRDLDEPVTEEPAVREQPAESSS